MRALVLVSVLTTASLATLTVPSCAEHIHHRHAKALSNNGLNPLIFWNDVHDGNEVGLGLGFSFASLSVRDLSYFRDYHQACASCGYGPALRSLIDQAAAASDAGKTRNAGKIQITFGRGKS